MLLALQLVAVATAPLNVTIPLPWGEPKLLPEIVTVAPTEPEETLKPLILGLPTTVKLLPALLTPLANTMTFPVVAPEGTVATMLLVVQLVTAAVVPLNLIVPLLRCESKLLPEIVTDAVTAPDVGDKLVMLGAGTTVKLTPLLFTPLAFTTTFPVAAPVGTVTVMLLEPQLVIEAVVPLNLTVPCPWVEPKLLPAITTEAPTAPVLGDRLDTLGAGTTTKFLALLSTPL